MAHTFNIDTRWLEYRGGQAGGAGVYIKQLVPALLKLDTQNAYHLWGSPVHPTAPNAHHYPFQGNWRRGWQLLWKTVGWPTVDLPAPRCDLWHFTNYVAPPTRKPFVVTIHDLTFVKHPGYVEPKNLEYLKRFVPDTLERAAQVIAVSESTRDGIIDAFGVSRNRITVVPHAAHPRFAEQQDPATRGRIAKKYGIDRDYLLTVGTLEPRKNLETLLLAFSAMRKHVREQLVVVGGQGWLFEETERLIRKLGLTDRVILTGYVPDAELPALFSGAKAFVFPSHYEGFGIPLLEAMTAGTPVVTSNTSSMPEVAGTAALYFDPDDDKGMRLAIERVLDDAKLRERLVEAGHEQAARFTWQRAAHKTLGAYYKALGVGNARVAPPKSAVK
ncbi:MAG TPA: glycosyltransferase family 1 protein [Patescibacteria group bacterium]|jgi:glycosyltransferase involved in cell wall biosynthesis